MGYSGYEQHLCENGHLFHLDSRNFEEEEICPVCGAPSAWANMVDDTNGEEWGAIPMETWNREFLLRPEVREVCNLGHSHVTEVAVYRVPTNEERDRFQNWGQDTDEGFSRVLINKA